MRLTVRLLGRELLDVELAAGSDPSQPEPEPGPPFGFSGGTSVHAELAGDWIPSELNRTTLNGTEHPPERLNK